MKKQTINMTMEAPKNWRQTLDNIRLVRKKYPAPVDSMGCDQVSKASEKTLERRFQVLVSLMLSSQTKDPITWAATQKLKDNNMCNVDGLLGAEEKDIEDLIHPVGFYRRKAIYLKKVAAILKEQYNGDIPDSIEGLCKLPGVGPKMAHLCMQEAWNVNSGIGVDTHVHRISARLGWVPAKNVKTPEDTRQALESWLPREYWREINHLLVGFGQTICTPLRPKCNECANNDICPSASAPANRSKQQPPAVGLKSRKKPSSMAPLPPPVKEELMESVSVTAPGVGTAKREVPPENDNGVFVKEELHVAVNVSVKLEPYALEIESLEPMTEKKEAPQKKFKKSAAAELEPAPKPKREPVPVPTSGPESEPDLELEQKSNRELRPRRSNGQAVCA